MNYFVFWVKIFSKRLVEFFKESPIILVGTIVIIFAFTVAFISDTLNISVPLTSEILLPTVVILGILSIMVSLRNNSVMPVLILYSKSCLRNEYIKIWFFIKQAIRRNIFLIIFVSIAFNEIVKTENFVLLAQILTIQTLSVFFSFMIMYKKNKCMNKSISKINDSKSSINPYAKSIFYDYVTPDLILMSILGVALSIGIIIGVFTNIVSFQQIEASSPIFIGIIIIFTISFFGIMDSIDNVNWKFHAIICPNHFSYHIQKTLKVWAGCFCFLIIAFCIIFSQFGFFQLVKYLYCLAVLALFFVFNAFSLSNPLFKFIKSIAFAILTIWISTLHFGFLVILLIPVLFMGFLAKSDFKERYLL